MLLKLCLTKPVFDGLKSRRTTLGATLYDVIQEPILQNMIAS
jgi:hypothetical protein